MSPVIRAAARRDILDQMAWYASQGVPNVVRRFRDSVLRAIDDLSAMPDAGPPRTLPDPRLAGLRRWPVTGFPEVWVYYLAKREGISILRVLHDKRDTDRHLSGR